MTLAVRRDIALEQEIVHEACRGYADPSVLLEHAQARSARLSGEYVPDPMQIRPGLDRLREMREEITDCVNHGLFWMQENMELVGGEEWLQMLGTIRLLTVLYNRLVD